MKSKPDLDPNSDDVVRVVICDDHPGFAQGLVMIFKAEAPSIEIVGLGKSGEDAVRLVEEYVPDVVLIDIYMPRMDGIEATRRIKTVSPTSKVLVLTVSHEQNDLYEAIKAGAIGYVSKETDPGEIARLVKAVASGHAILPAEFVPRLVRDLEKARPAIELSDIERQLLAGIGRGETDREIASHLAISERTVRRRKLNLFEKLGLADRIQAAVYAATHRIGEDLPRKGSRGG